MVQYRAAWANPKKEASGTKVKGTKVKDLVGKKSNKVGNGFTRGHHISTKSYGNIQKRLW
jgi:hypothetical protein